MSPLHYQAGQQREWNTVKGLLDLLKVDYQPQSAYIICQHLADLFVTKLSTPNLCDSLKPWRIGLKAAQLNHCATKYVHMNNLNSVIVPVKTTNVSRYNSAWMQANLEHQSMKMYLNIIAKPASSQQEEISSMETDTAPNTLKSPQAMTRIIH